MKPENPADKWQLTDIAYPWRPGVLFHKFRRFKEVKGRRIDRLLSILDLGLMSPAHLPDAVSDIRITANSVIPYDSVIFLHEYNPPTSFPYTLSFLDGVCVFVKNSVPIRRHHEMGDDWPVASQSEVYALEPIPPTEFEGLWLPPRYANDAALIAHIGALGLTLHV